MSFQQYKLCIITQSCSGFLLYDLVHPACFPVNQSTFWWSCNEGPIVLILSFLSDMEYHKSFLPSYWSRKLEFLSLFTEKKVEIFHSLLRENSNQHDDGKSPSEVAKVIASCGILSAFKECFCSCLPQRCL